MPKSPAPPTHRIVPKILSFTTLVMFAAGTVGPSRSAAQEPLIPRMVVGEIAFEGLLSWEPEDLRSRLNLSIGEPYDQLLESEDLRELSRIMRRVSVHRELMPGDKIRLTFVVDEFPRLRQVQVIGNRSVADERIDILLALKQGDVIDNNVVEALKRALRAEYTTLGMPSTKINVSLSVVLPREIAPDAPLEFAQADLHVLIEEGDKIRVDDVVLDGNEVFSDWRLKVALETKGTWLFGIVKNYYDEDAFVNDLVKLRNFYTSNGYFDVLVERGTFAERQGDGELIITPTIKIQEGEKYQLATVDVRGARLFSPQEISEPFEMMIGEPFDGRRFSSSLQQVLDTYYEQGFLTTEIQPDYTYDSENKLLHLTLEVAEEDRIFAGDILLERPNQDVDEAPGLFQRFYERIAPPISDEAIRREIMLEPGRIYDKRLERESRRRLEQMGVFQMVSVTNRPTANPRVHDVVVSIEEGVTGEFSAGVGFGDVGGGFVYGQLNERNLFGEGRDLGLQLQLGTRFSSGVISYTDRHFRDSSDTLAARLFYTTYRRLGYIESVTGTHVELSRPLYGDWDGGVRGRLEFVSVEERAGRDPDEDINDSYPVLTGRLRLSQDSLFPRDSPVEGRRIDYGLEAGWAGGPLLKFTLAGDYAYTLGPNLRYRFMPTVGIIPYSSSAVGITERFFLGGNDDMRGFESQGAGRRDSGDERVALGGAVKLLARNELHFPIYDPVGGVVFLDAGVLGKNPFSYEFPRLSTGFGLRMRMPPATTVAVDFALPLLRRSGDQTQFIHFSFQSAL